MNTVPRFEKKLTLYSIAGAAAFAAAGTASATIVHVNVGTTVNETGTYAFNLSGPIAADITITAAPANNFQVPTNTVSAAAIASSEVQLNVPTGQVAALAFGDLIDPAHAAPASWGSGGKMADSLSTFQWPTNGGFAYLGFYFTDGTGEHAGWADIATTANVDGSSFTVNDFAYETVANESLTAGQLTDAAGPGRGAVPEPASIALLAMGAAGMAVVRRRRRALNA